MATCVRILERQNAKHSDSGRPNKEWFINENHKVTLISPRRGLGRRHCAFDQLLLHIEKVRQNFVNKLKFGGYDNKVSYTQVGLDQVDTQTDNSALFITIKVDSSIFAIFGYTQRK